jgi:hypothetical protein
MSLDAHLLAMSSVARSVLDEPSPAKRKAIILLVAHLAGTSQRKAKRVIVAMSHLHRKYGSR